MTEDFNHLFERLQGSLDTMRTDPQAAADFALPEVEAHGTALEEQIRVTMGTEEFTELTIDPRAMRQSNAELAHHLLEAFNAALADHNRQLATALTAQHPATDESLQSELRQIQNQSVRAMKTYTDSLMDALGQVRRLSERE